MTPLETKLNEIKARLEKATPGPWDATKNLDGVYAGTNSLVHSGKLEICGPRQVGRPHAKNVEANASFIAHARTDIEKLLKTVEIQAKALDDFKSHGTRHDINPTGQFKSCGCFDSFKGDNWQSYIKSQDEYVKQKAREALKEAQEVWE